MTTVTEETKLLELTDLNFEKEALQSALPILVDFTAAWCAPCRTIKPHVEAVANEGVGVMPTLREISKLIVARL